MTYEWAYYRAEKGKKKGQTRLHNLTCSVVKIGDQLYIYDTIKVLKRRINTEVLCAFVL